MKGEIEIVEIRQVENGYLVYLGYSCEPSRESYVFQSFTELTNFLNSHFKHRNENIFSDYSNQIQIPLKN
jgi:hypothetical protein